MILLSEVGADQGLQGHTHAVHHDAELDQTDDHSESDLPGIAVTPGNKADHQEVHQSPADIYGRIHDTVSRRQQEVFEGQMPNKAKCILFLEEM